ncbi:hypothetical protein [Pseudomonas sp. NFACC13-1]|uniref:hypothetical protein n=1 Tax=Pseudomonas sp. NFACC13-1 TaxID=1566245 RepID=UPI0008868DAD|nr:hypothetical protein [Pseudomonas sp. NFACC13-1]SDB25041.1 hypothetical protein SAMN03159290_01820 [Pseudomonas sp. NFACC13-1]
MASVLTQSLVEFMESVALANGGRWDHHAYCYLNFQTSVQVAVEEGDSFGALPGAFSTTKQFFKWAKLNGLTKVSVGTPSNPAFMTHGVDNSSFNLRGSSFIWVKATSSKYRVALLAWLNYLRDDRKLFEVQGRAAIVYERVAASVEAGAIRKKVSPGRRAKLVKIFRAMAERCQIASSSEQAAIKDSHLLKPFDSTLDADHVINKKSLKDLPHAWVMLAPVIASSNRRFGLAVEQYAVPFTAQQGPIGLDAVTTFKLFAATFPSTANTLDKQVTAFRKRFIPRGPGLQAELETVADKLRGFVDRTNTTFIR